MLNLKSCPIEGVLCPNNTTPHNLLIELLWIIKGEGNIRELAEQGVTHYNKLAFEHAEKTECINLEKAPLKFSNETEFIEFLIFNRMDYYLPLSENSMTAWRGHINPSLDLSNSFKVVPQIKINQINIALSNIVKDGFPKYVTNFDPIRTEGIAEKFNKPPQAKYPLVFGHLIYKEDEKLNILVTCNNLEEEEKGRISFFFNALLLMYSKITSYESNSVTLVFLENPSTLIKLNSLTSLTKYKLSITSNYYPERIEEFKLENFIITKE